MGEKAVEEWGSVGNSWAAVVDDEPMHFNCSLIDCIRQFIFSYVVPLSKLASSPSQYSLTSSPPRFSAPPRFQLRPPQLSEIALRSMHAIRFGF